MRSERIQADPDGLGTGGCELARRWTLDPTLAAMLVALEGMCDRRFSTEFARWPGLYIISGYRPSPVVPALDPTAPAAEKSRHMACPSLAADLRVGNRPASLTAPEVWAAVGTLWKILGGRWGGDFRRPDPNHFDIDPRLAGRF